MSKRKENNTKIKPNQNKTKIKIKINKFKFKFFQNFLSHPIYPRIKLILITTYPSTIRCAINKLANENEQSTSTADKTHMSSGLLCTTPKQLLQGCMNPAALPMCQQQQVFTLNKHQLQQQQSTL